MRILRIYAILLWGFFSQQTFAKTDFLSLDAEQGLKEALAAQWGQARETPSGSRFDRALRWLRTPLSRLLYGKFTRQLGAVFKIPYDFIHPARSGRTTLYNSAVGTVLSPLMPISYLISDVVSAAMAFKYTEMEMTPRVLTCSVKFPILPFEHIYFLVDNGDIHNDNFSIYRNSNTVLNHHTASPGLATCFTTPIASRESPSVAIERLNCMSKAHTPQYADFFKYNCGGLTRALLTHSGFAFPDFSNLGIGSNLADIPAAAREAYDSFRPKCDAYIEDLRQIIFDLESSKDIAEEQLAALLSFQPRKDVLLQLAISSVHGHNLKNRLLVRDVLKKSGLDENVKTYLQLDDSPSGFSSSGLKVHAIYKDTLQRMFANTTMEEREWLRTNYDAIRAVLEGLGLV